MTLEKRDFPHESGNADIGLDDLPSLLHKKNAKMKMYCSPEDRLTVLT